MKTLYSESGDYAVEFIGDSPIMAVAVMCDGQSYGGNSYWFTIGHYKTEQTAIRQAIKKMAQMNITISA